ncbi:3-oxoacid CoA-transferase subunit A [Achromobacter xylosoxidans]
MIDKFIDTPAAAVADIHDGATVLVSGFGGAGMPTELLHALIEQGARELTVVSNNAGNHETGLAALIKAGRVRKVICSFPKASHSWVFDDLYRRGGIELECVPQGTIAERLRAAGAGLGGFFTPRPTAPNWPPARKPASSMAAAMYSRRRCTATSPWSRPIWPTAGAT